VPNDAGKTNKIFCTTMGSSTDLQSEGLRRLVVNAVYWGVGLGVPPKNDVTYVGEYKPTMYGTKKEFKPGVKPAELALPLSKDKAEPVAPRGAGRTESPPPVTRPPGDPGRSGRPPETPGELHRRPRGDGANPGL